MAQNILTKTQKAYLYYEATTFGKFKNVPANVGNHGLRYRQVTSSHDADATSRADDFPSASSPHTAKGHGGL